MLPLQLNLLLMNLTPRNSDYVVSATHSFYHCRNRIGLNTFRRVSSKKGTGFARTDRLRVLERARTS